MFIDRFTCFLQYEKRYSAHTVTAYCHDLETYLAYLDKHHLTVSDVIHRDVRSFLAMLVDAGLQPSSVNRAISTLRTYYKFLNREGLSAHNPMQLVKALRTPKKLPVVVDEHKLVELLDSRDLFPEGFEGIRDQLVMELLFGTGMRREELSGLQETDIDFYHQTVRVLGKRNKERLIPLHRSLLHLLDSYLKEKKDCFRDTKSHHLIVTMRGDQAGPGLIYRIVKKYLSFISSQQKRSPHVLRHTFATTLLNKGADLNDIKELLGHAGLAATQLYTHNSVERLKAIYKQAHPKA